MLSAEGDVDLREAGSNGMKFVHPELGGAEKADALAQEAVPATKVKVSHCRYIHNAVPLW